jgi:pyridoxal phosphate enzyme (YggS family)
MTTAVAATAEIGGRIEAVRGRIARACGRAGRDASTVTLIAVSKTRPAEEVAAAWGAGLRDFGENYVQEGARKFGEAAALIGGPHPAPFIRHFIGHLQSNKVNMAVDAFDVIHSIDAPGLLERAGHRATRRLPVFVQVNLAGEASKGGAAPGDVPALVDRARQSANVEILGLMTIPPPGAAEDARTWFRQLAALARTHGLHHLSMGMTDDFEVAIEEGATHIRVGRAIFGERGA